MPDAKQLHNECLATRSTDNCPYNNFIVLAGWPFNAHNIYKVHHYMKQSYSFNQKNKKLLANEAAHSLKKENLVIYG